MGKLKNKLKKELDRDIRRVKVEVYHDIKYVKTHIPKVITAFMVLIFFVILLVLFKTKQGDKFNQSPEDMVAFASTRDYVIKPAKVQNLLEDTTYQFIDIRSNQERKVYKMDKATHIPFEQILAEDFKSVWRNETKKILVCENEIESTQAWLLLSELGYTNILVLEGGMNYWKKYTLSKFGLKKDESQNDEKPKYDYAKVMKSFKK